MVLAEHTTKAFDYDLQELARMIAEMGGLAERQIVEVIEALTRRDIERARRSVAADAVIDALQRSIEERAVETIARRQPMAIDLRGVVGVLRISNELERIGDLAKNIGKRVIALDSFARWDLAKARAVKARDHEVDRMYTSMFRELLTYMLEDPGTIASGLHLLFCSKNIE